MLLGTPIMEYDSGTYMRPRRPLILLVLAAWVLLGPVAMAFDGCGMCDEGCVLSGIPVSLETSSALRLVADIVPLSPDRVVAVTLKTLEPPPKSLLSA